MDVSLLLLCLSEERKIITNKKKSNAINIKCHWFTHHIDIKRKNQIEFGIPYY